VAHGGNKGDNTMKNFFKRLIGNWWVVRKCGFPYKKGYATYNKFKNTILDTGLTKEQANQICDELNGISRQSTTKGSIMRIIKQSGVYKIQELKRFLWFKPYWKTLQYESIDWEGANSTDEDYKFLTIEEAKEFIKEWYRPHPIEVISYE